MVVTPDGRAYVDAYDDHFDRSSHRILMVTPERDVAVVARDVVYPNGITTTPDGTTLLVAETFAGRITAFVVEADGTLGRAGRGRSCRPARIPTGCASTRGRRLGRLVPRRRVPPPPRSGEVLDCIAVAGRWAMSCCLGGDDGQSLLLCTAETTQDDYFAGRSVGHLDVVRVDVPGVERP